MCFLLQRNRFREFEKMRRQEYALNERMDKIAVRNISKKELSNVTDRKFKI